MCTVSWLPSPSGYTLCFNRDERFTRTAALPPALRSAGDVPFLAPLDGDFGGTWIMVNACGLTLGVLNRYQSTAHTPNLPARSRGLLPIALADQPSAVAASRLLATMDLGHYQPFTLVAIDPDAAPLLAAWDGATLEVTRHPEPGFLLTSSSVTEPEVAEARRAAFAGIGDVTLAALEAVHRSHWPERGRRSVCMHREEAETQCFTEVRIDSDRVTMIHIPDAPCRGARLPALSVARRAAPCPTIP